VVLTLENKNSQTNMAALPLKKIKLLRGEILNILQLDAYLRSLMRTQYEATGQEKRKD
jgi:hypothetical protein